MQHLAAIECSSDIPRHRLQRKGPAERKANGPSAETQKILKSGIFGFAQLVGLGAHAGDYGAVLSHLQNRQAQ